MGMLAALRSKIRPPRSPPRSPEIVDYSEARAKAIAWLGDRYLLAQPVNRHTLASSKRLSDR